MCVSLIMSQGILLSTFLFMVIGNLINYVTIWEEIRHLFDDIWLSFYSNTANWREKWIWFVIHVGKYICKRSILWKSIDKSFSKADDGSIQKLYFNLVEQNVCFYFKYKKMEMTNLATLSGYYKKIILQTTVPIDVTIYCFILIMLYEWSLREIVIVK